MKKVRLRYKRVDDGRQSTLAEVREDICYSSDRKSFNCYILIVLTNAWGIPA